MVKQLVRKRGEDSWLFIFSVSCFVGTMAWLLGLVHEEIQLWNDYFSVEVSEAEELEVFTEQSNYENLLMQLQSRHKDVAASCMKR